MKLPRFSLRSLLLLFAALSVYATIAKLSPLLGTLILTVVLYLALVRAFESASNLLLKLLLLLLMTVTFVAFIMSLILWLDETFPRLTLGMLA